MVQLSIINDPALQDYAAIAISEPHAWSAKKEPHEAYRSSIPEKAGPNDPTRRAMGIPLYDVD